MKTLFPAIARFVVALVAFLARRPAETVAQGYMRQAREMVAVARLDKAQGYHCAARAAVQSAMSYRAAYHAERFYSARNA